LHERAVATKPAPARNVVEPCLQPALIATAVHVTAPAAKRRLHYVPAWKRWNRVEAIPEVTALREAQGRFLFTATVELFEQYGFTVVAASGSTPGS
jgi:hypothetical protein